MKFWYPWVVLCLAVPLFAAPSQQQLLEKWLAANKAFKQAQSQQDYRRAAAMFQGLVQSGVRNGYLYYNLANSYLKAGELGQAVLHYRRAQLYIDEPDILSNLEYARLQVSDKVQFSVAESSQLASIFSWHFAMASSDKWLLLSIAFVAFWAALTLRLFRVPFPFWTLVIIAAFLSVAMGGSLLYETYIEAQKPAAVLVGDDIEVRTGNARSYGLLYGETEIPAGVEVRVVEVREEWSRVELPDGATGWVPAHNVEKVVDE